MSRKENRVFRMKRFAICDNLSANKIGVDGVLTGSWAMICESDRNILDVGCGCGIISIMMAQRHPSAMIYGIDIDINAIVEASQNASTTEWRNRLNFYQFDFSQLGEKESSDLPPEFDLIISNPPFFDSGVDPTESLRMTARHAGSLSPAVLIEKSAGLLSESGRLVFICPYYDADRYEELSRANGLMLNRKCIIKGRPELPPKRVIFEFCRKDSGSDDSEENPKTETLIIEESPGNYSEDYIALGKPFYLKF